MGVSSDKGAKSTFFVQAGPQNPAFFRLCRMLRSEEET